MTLEELGEYGMEHMDDDEIRRFLTSQSTGVLGLPTDGAPYMIPLSYAFDGEAELYFYFILGAESRKDELAERARSVGFLVYRADTAFNWRSAVLTGPIEEVPEQEWNAIRERTTIAWRPEVLATASESEAIKLYRFDIEQMTGIKHTGLPPAFDDRSGDAGD